MNLTPLETIRIDARTIFEQTLRFTHDLAYGTDLDIEEALEKSKSIVSDALLSAIELAKSTDVEAKKIDEV